MPPPSDSLWTTDAGVYDGVFERMGTIITLLSDSRPHVVRTPSPPSTHSPKNASFYNRLSRQNSICPQFVPADPVVETPGLCRMVAPCAASVDTGVICGCRRTVQRGEVKSVVKRYP